MDKARQGHSEHYRKRKVKGFVVKRRGLTLLKGLMVAVLIAALLF